MTNDPFYRHLRESGWRRPLSAEEEAKLSKWLDVHPEAQADWEAEIGLNQALERLPEAPAVSSNFTARVMQAVELEKSRAEQALPSNRVSLFGLLRWLPKTAVAALTVGLALLSYHHFREVHRVQLARDAVVVSEVASLPNATVLEDFEVIRAMSRTPAADEELLKLLQ